MTMRAFDHLTRAEKAKVVVAVVLIAPCIGFPLMVAASHGALDIDLSLSGCSSSGEPTTLAEPVSEHASFAADGVRGLDVTWHGGSLVVERGPVDAVEVSEEVPAGTYEMDPTRATFTMRGDTLVVDDGLPGSDGGRAYPDMRLTITLPQDGAPVLGSVELATDSARVSVGDLSCEKLAVSSVSASVELSGVTADGVELADVSGSYALSASTVGELEVNTVSGSQTLEFGDDLPRSLRVSSVSGDTKLTLPADAGFTLHVPEALGPDLRLRDGVTRQDETTYRSGDGALDVTLDSVGGTLTVA